MKGYFTLLTVFKGYRPFQFIENEFFVLFLHDDALILSSLRLAVLLCSPGI